MSWYDLIKSVGPKAIWQISKNKNKNEIERKIIKLIKKKPHDQISQLIQVLKLNLLRVFLTWFSQLD